MVLAYSLDHEEQIPNIFFHFLCLARFRRSSRRKVRKAPRNNNNEPAIRRDLLSLTSAKREAGTSPVVTYERASDWIKRSARLNKAYERLDLSDRVKCLVLKYRKTLNLQACFVG